MDFTNDRLDKLEEKLDKIVDNLISIDKTLVKQEAELSEHILRTTFAEKRLEHIENDILPIKVHVNKVQGAFQLLGVISVIVAIVTAIIQFFK